MIQTTALAVLALVLAPAAAGAQQLLTVAERSDYKATSRHAEVSASL